MAAQLPDGRLDEFLRLDAERRAERRRRRLGIALVSVAAIWLAARQAEVHPPTLLSHLDRLTDYFGRTLTLESGRPVWTDPADWFWGLGKWLRLIGETVLIAYLGTVFGTLGAIGFCFVAANGVSPAPWARFVAKRSLELARTVPELVFALLFVAAFGLGPLAGVLALALHSLGALGKQFTEVVENTDSRPLDGVRACGAGWFAGVRFAILPQVLPDMASYVLLRFETNVRESAIIGLVGAGGIGQDLLVAVRRFYYADVSAMLVLIIATVSIIDVLAERLRRRFIRGGAGA